MLCGEQGQDCLIKLRPLSTCARHTPSCGGGCNDEVATRCSDLLPQFRHLGHREVDTRGGEGAGGRCGAALTSGAGGRAVGRLATGGAIDDNLNVT